MQFVKISLLLSANLWQITLKYQISDLVGRYYVLQIICFHIDSITGN